MYWKPVSKIEDIPNGDWLVQLDDGKMVTAHISKLMQVVGGRFHFDMKPIVAYMPLPKPYVGVENEETNI
ncbi:hypothetical protein [Enterobacter kobei]|uniref:hypothetical protein n=1 Tax=Enterobacter kobei TaxID=208224 RepID=UPI003B83FD8F